MEVRVSRVVVVGVVLGVRVGGDLEEGLVSRGGGI